MKTVLRIFIISISIIVLFVSVSKGQSIDFSGRWVINKDKTNFGVAPEFTLPRQFEVRQENDKITITRAMLDAQLNEHPLTEVLSFKDVSTESITYSGSKRTVSIKWNENHQSFVLTSKSQTADGKGGLAIAENWSLEDDTVKSLVILRSVKQPNGTIYTIKAYYDKK